MTHSFLHGAGKIGDIIAAHDWCSTPLGAIPTWPQSLRTTVALILRSPVAMVTMWGEQGVMIYNEAYSLIAGSRHPGLLGANVRQAWPEVPDFNDNVMNVGLSGATLSYVDQEMILHRSGVPEQVWLTLDYSPIIGEDNLPAGVMAIVVDTSAKVRAERRLNGEHARLHTMFEQAPGFMAMLSGPEHVFTLANQAYFDLVGQRQVLGKTVRAALPEAAGQGFIDLLDRMYASGEAYSGSSMPFSLAPTADGPGEERYVDFVYQPLKDESGAVFGIFVQGADVSDRVLAEQAVRARESQFRTMAQALPNQVWGADVDGNLDWFNERVYSYCGLERGRLDGGNWVSIVHEDDVGSAASAWAAAIRNGQIYETEFRIRNADSRYRWHLVRALPIRSESGAIIRWVGTNTDIEDQKAAARALASLNETLEQRVQERTAERDRMWRLATDIMLVADLEGRIVDVNPAFSRLLGWDSGDAIGRSFAELSHPDERAATAEAIAALKQGKLSFKLEHRLQRSDGGYNILSWTGAPDDEHLHAVGRDMTFERNAAEAIRRSELALAQSQKMETIGKLTGGVAHDFNNLLQVISGNLQLLARDVAGNERAEKRLNNALGGVARGAKLASYLLAFGRRQALEPRVVKIGSFVTAMEDMLRRSLGEEIQIEMIISGGLWNTLIDTAQVENAVLNLCINARDAMDGAGRLTIEVGNALLDDDYARRHPDVTSGQYVMIAVSDTGSGMTPEVLSQAFEPFYSTKPEGKGTGLGLSMVYGFVKQSGGHVKIYSEVSNGTTVKLYLPRSFDAEDSYVPVDTRPVVGGTETILVAEDDDNVRATVVELLGELGYRVLKANDAASALAVIDSGAAIDMLFTDVVMPGPLRSPELARKARERLPDIAVLFTSGYTENAIVHGGRLDAGVDLLGKPYTREALARKIRHVLANRRQRAQPLAELRAGFSSAAAQQTRLRILLVEDEETIRHNTAELLELSGHTVQHAGSAEEGLALLDAAAPDLLITDISLPGMSGLALAEKARSLLPQLTVIVASGQAEQLSLPGAVLLLKPYNGAALAAALRDAGSGG
ncbi:MAG: PAS domain S-box protein [Noviherbaspirillum sp.]